MYKLVFAITVFILGFSAHAQSSDAEDIRVGYLARCWAENASDTVDGTFIVQIRFSDEASRASTLNKVLRFLNEGGGINDKSGIVLLGKPYGYPEQEGDAVTRYLVQADFQNRRFPSRQALKEAVARTLIAATRIPGVDAYCKNRSPFKPSISGSN
jgi:hypothetical protein